MVRENFIGELFITQSPPSFPQSSYILLEMPKYYIWWISFERRYFCQNCLQLWEGIIINFINILCIISYIYKMQATQSLYGEISVGVQEVKDGQVLKKCQFCPQCVWCSWIRWLTCRNKTMMRLAAQNHFIDICRLKQVCTRLVACPVNMTTNIDWRSANLHWSFEHVQKNSCAECCSLSYFRIPEIVANMYISCKTLGDNHLCWDKQEKVAKWQRTEWIPLAFLSTPKWFSLKRSCTSRQVTGDSGQPEQP